eukprot:146105_1
MSLAPAFFKSERSLKELQNRYIDNVDRLFTEFMQSKDQILKQLELNDIQIKVAKVSQTEEIIRLLQVGFERNPVDKVLNASRKTIPFYIAKLKKAISLRRCFIAVDKNTNKIISTNLYEDVFDNFYAEKGSNLTDLNELGANYKHIVEIFEYVDYVWQNALKNNLTQFDNVYEAKFGKYLAGSNIVTKLSHKGRFIAFIMVALPAMFLVEKCGYKLVTGDVSNRNLISLIKIVTMNTKLINIIKVINLSQYTFKDGTKIDKYFHALKEREPQLDIEKFKKEMCNIAIFVSKAPSMKQMIKLITMIKYYKKSRTMK